MSIWDKISGTVMTRDPTFFKRFMEAREKNVELRCTIFDLNEKIYAMKSDMERMVANRMSEQADMKRMLDEKAATWNLISNLRNEVKTLKEQSCVPAWFMLYLESQHKGKK